MGKLNIEEEKPNFRHFSHEHPLELTGVCETGHIICSGCMTEIVPGRNYYTCRACEYSLHHACFNKPRSFQHAADPNHDLELLLCPSFHCKACGIPGSGFSYSCSICHVHYHSSCTQLPPTKHYSMHPHALELEFSPPYGNPKGFRCDICGTVGGDHWLYHCKVCEFDAHLGCAMSATTTSPAHINVKSVASSTSCPTYVNQNQKTPPNENYGNPSQFQSQLTNNYVMRATTSGTPISHGGNYAGGTPISPGGAYAGGTPIAPGGAYAGNVMQPSGGYVYNQGGYVQPVGMGMGYASQPGIGGGAQSILGAGMAGLVVAGMVTGVGEAVGQGIIHGVAGGFSNDGPGYSDQNV